MKLSVCMMVKNEEKNLKRCLSSLKKITDKVNSEIIIVDTGSEDRTIEVAKQYTEKVYFHKWNDDFSEMRNITISYAKGEWILIIDADEEVEYEHGILNFLNMKKSPSISGASVDVKSFTSSKNIRASISASPRLFKNDGYFHYYGAVHNEPMYKGNIAKTDSIFFHYGYIADDKELMEKKFQRTSNILKKELEKNPNNIYYRFQLSISYDMYGNKEEALKEIKKAYNILKQRGLNPKKNIYIYSQLASCYVENNLLEEAKLACKEGIDLESEYIDLYFLYARSSILLEDNEKAIKYYERYISLVENFENLNIRLNGMIKQNYLNSIDEAYYNLGFIYYKKGIYEKALEFSEKVEKCLHINEKIIKNNKHLKLDIVLKLRDFNTLRDIYIKQKEEDLQDDNTSLSKIVLKIEEEMKSFDIYDYEKFLNIFAELDDLYGELNSIRNLVQKDVDRDYTRKCIQDFIVSYDFNKLQEFCGDVMYYAVKYNIKISSLFSRMTESNIIEYLKYLDEKYKDLPSVIIRYLEKAWIEESYDDIRCNKILRKYLLFSGYLKDEEYKVQFKQYIEEGTKFIEYLYSEYLIENELINDVKNIEEAFLLYILKANRDKKKYLEYIKKASELYQYMSRGVKLLLEEFEEEISDPINDEMESLKNSFKQNIKSMIKDDNLEVAEELINQYEQMVSNDIDILLFKSEIAMKKTYQSNNIH